MTKPPPFRPSAPKPAETVSLTELKKLARDPATRLLSAKDIGLGVLKVFTAGPKNYYINGTRTAHAYLRRCGITV